MSEFLKRYVETALLASTLLILAKIVGVWIAIAVTKTQFSLVTAPELLTYLTVPTFAQAKSITTIADGIFISFLVIFGVIVLIRTMLFNDLTRHPRVLVKVIHYNLTGWLEDGKSMYPTLFAWGTFIWLSVILVIKDHIDSGISISLPVVAGSFAIVYTYQVFSFLDTHISDMISYLYGTNRKTN